MQDLFTAIIAIHKGFTMTGYEWEPDWTMSLSLANGADDNEH